MILKVKDTINKYSMIQSDDTIYVGLSGGADSVSLLLTLCELKPLYGISIHAIHINHQLRGEESFRDENFCVELCNRLNVPITVKRIDVTSYCNSHKVSTEEGARILRYKAFDEVANGNKIATAHTLSDDCETILYNLSRGAGIKGLIGIPPVRDNIIRPLIACTRSDVEEYLRLNHMDYVTDSTNLLDDYTRNKVRHNVIPVLKSINPKFEHKVLDTISILQEEEDYIQSSVDSIYDKYISKDGTTLDTDLRTLHSAVRHRIIARLFKSNGLEYSREKILSIDTIILSGGKINITKDVYTISNMGNLSIVTIPDSNSIYSSESVELVLNGKVSLFNKTIGLELQKNTTFINRKLTNYIVDYDKIQGVIHARGRIFGDKVRLQGRGFTSSVKKLLNQKVPKELRNTLCFITDDYGIIAMEGFGVAQRVACDNSTKNFLCITILQNSI